MAAATPISKPLQELSTFLDNYWNRNQVFRTVQFASTLCAGLLERRFPSAAGKFATLSYSISNMRTTLRLMDDIPMFAYTLKSWKPQKDSSLLLQLADLLFALSCQLYYPIEHIAWAADLKLISVQPASFWTGAILLWGISLLASALRSLITLWRVGREIVMLQSHGKPPASPTSPTSSSSRNGNGQKRVTFQDESTSTETRLRVLRQMYLKASLGLLQSVCDLMNAVHWLPAGFLWSGKLPTLWVGIFGTLSSLLGLYQILPRKSKLYDRFYYRA